MSISDTDDEHAEAVHKRMKVDEFVHVGSKSNAALAQGPWRLPDSLKLGPVPAFKNVDTTRFDVPKPTPATPLVPPTAFSATSPFTAMGAASNSRPVPDAAANQAPSVPFTCYTAPTGIAYPKQSSPSTPKGVPCIDDKRFRTLRDIVVKSDVIDNMLLERVAEMFTLRDRAISSVLDSGTQSRIQDTFDRRLELISDSVYTLTFVQFLDMPTVVRTDQKPKSIAMCAKPRTKNRAGFQMCWTLGRTLYVGAVSVFVLLPLLPMLSNM